MATVEAKLVRIDAPGGVTLNFQGQTGRTHMIPLKVAHILKLIKQGARVEELVTTGDPILLNEDNYANDNSAKNAIAVTSDDTVVGDIEADAEAKNSARDAEYLASVSAMFKELYSGVKAAASTVLNIFSVADKTLSTTLNATDYKTNAPTSVMATLSDGSTKEVLVEWNWSGFTTAKTGTFTVLGELLIDDTESNTNKVEAKLVVTVYAASATIDPDGSADGTN